VILIATAWAQAPKPATPEVHVDATMNQLMQGIVFPNSNVIFATQTENPADVKTASKPAIATDPLTSVFGKWQAVENSALAIAESANLLMLPGRKCANGVDVPLKNADWAEFVKEMRSAGLASYKAAQAKNLEQIVASTDGLAQSCQNCHQKYRDVRGAENRCR